MLEAGQGGLCFGVQTARDFSGVETQILEARLYSGYQGPLRLGFGYGVQMTNLQGEVQPKI